MAKQEQKIQEVTARLGDLHMSPRKVRLVTDMVKNKSVAAARIQLQLLNKKAAFPVLKLIESAVASGQHNFKMNPDQLFIKNITVNQGRVMKRFQARAQGRAFPIRRRIAVVDVILAINPKLKVLKKRPVTKPTTANLEPEIDTSQNQAQHEVSGQEPKILQPKGKRTDAKSRLKKGFVDIKRRLFNRKTNA